MYFKADLTNIRHWVCAAGLLCLGACSDAPQIFMSERYQQVYVIQDDFQDTLTAEYTNLARFEELENLDKEIAQRFYVKAKDASWGKDVPPERIADFPSIPMQYHEELEKARGMLIDAIDTMMIPENEGLLAISQVKYDCWLRHHSVITDPSMEPACRTHFYSALKNLQMPGTHTATYDVYFGSNETFLSSESTETIKNVADVYDGKNHWTVILTGYTDPVGNRWQNKTLSLRRAMAVKNALGQHGVPLDNIAISAKGEISTDDSDAKSRRVNIAFKPGFITDEVIRDITEAEGWTHIGGN